MVHELICAYKLDKLMDIIIPKTASEEELCLFHSNYYLSYLKTECSNNESDSSKKNNTFSSDDESNDSDVDDEQLDYGLGSVFQLLKKNKKIKITNMLLRI